MAMEHRGTTQKVGDEKGKDVRTTNILAARAVADTVRTSLGPKGMDKMIQDPKGEVIISNDGATILQQMKLVHPTAKMMVELSKAQDVEAGDGTTSVVVIAGALLAAAEKLLGKGIHPQTITEAFLMASEKAEEVLKESPFGMSEKNDFATPCFFSLPPPKQNVKKVFCPLQASPDLF